MSRISVIMPCYNAAKYIDKSIKSVMNQSIGLDNIELIIVDDCSTDNSENKIMSWEKRYPENIIYIKLEENAGPGNARNVGMEYSTGDYIGFVDADDWIDKSMYKQMIEFAEKNNCDMVGSLISREFPDGKSAVMNKYVEFSDEFDAVININDRVRVMMQGPNGGICSKIFKRNTIVDNGVIFPSGIFFEDDYWLDILDLYVRKFKMMNKVFYHYRYNPSSTVNNVDMRYFHDRLSGPIIKLKEYNTRGFLNGPLYPFIEAKFLHSYYITTYNVFMNKLGEVPKEMHDEMCATVKQLFPNGYKNHVLNDDDLKFIEKAYK